MVIENILKHEILGINKDIIKKRTCIKELLRNPVIEEGDKKINVNKKCLEKIADDCTLPLSEIFLPITFFIQAGSYEGYLTSKIDMEIVASMGYELYERNGKFWIAKYKIRKLETMCKGIFQSVVVP